MIKDIEILESKKFNESNSIQHFHYDESGYATEYDNLLKKHNLKIEERDKYNGFYHMGGALEYYTVAPVFDKDGNKICWGMYWPDNSFSKFKTKKGKKEFERLLETPELSIVAISYDSFITKHGMVAMKTFLQKRKVMMVCDESHRIKNPKAQRTKTIIKAGPYALYRMIASGTPVGNSPFDIYCQFEFLKPGLLGHRSYATFCKEFGIFERIGLGPYIPITTKVARMGGGYTIHDKFIYRLNSACTMDGRPLEIGRVNIGNYNKKAEFVLNGDSPSVIQLMYTKVIKPPFEKVKSYRNLDRLNKLIAPYSSRILKEDVLDLPPKIYKKVYMEMSPEQTRLYKSMREDCIAELQGEVTTATIALVKVLRMQQIVCGYLPSESEDKYVPIEEGITNRIKTTLEVVQDNPGKTIIWARFTHDIEVLLEELKNLGIEAVRYDGKTSDAQRTYAKVAFQAQEPGVYTVGSGATEKQVEVKTPARVFIGNQSAGGEGLTLHAASLMIFHSNDTKAIARYQAEDRAHRAGLKHSVTYVDIVCPNTVDDKFFMPLLRDKRELASQITGDTLEEWI